MYPRSPWELVAHLLRSVQHTSGTNGLDEVFRDRWICGRRRTSPVHRDSSCFGFTSRGAFMETSIETEEGLLARIVAECGTVQNRLRLLERVCRSMFRNCSVSNKDDGRHLGQLFYIN